MTDQFPADDASAPDQGHPSGDGAALPERFAELAKLGRALLAAEARVAELAQENIGLQRALVRAQKLSDLAEVSAADQAKLNEAERTARALSQDLERLNSAVTEKERARFALQEEVWALSEAMSELQENGGNEDSEPSMATYVQEVVRLTNLLRNAETQLQDSEQKVAEITLELKAGKAAPPVAGRESIGISGLTEMRAAMTRLVAERDRALLQAERKG